MNNFSVEDSTRTSSRFLSNTLPDLELDAQFERRLPPEILAELEGKPRPQTYRLRETVPSYLRPPPPRAPRAAPPCLPQTVASSPSAPLQTREPPPVPPIVARPTRSASRPGARPWLWIVAMLLAIPVLNALLPHRAPMVEVRRALPVALRALPVTVEMPVISGEWRSLGFSDGSTMQIHYGGQLLTTAQLPAQGHIGDAYTIGDHYWIWQHPTGQPASWIDP